jgi:AraC family transcriptional regulator
MAAREATNKEYLERINKVLEYIQDNMNEKLSVEYLAKTSNFSPFHFHRIMHAFLREPLGSYIKRVRLEKAAQLLNLSNQNIQEIAWEVGYENAASFNKAFKQRFKLSPSEFKNNSSNYQLQMEIVQINKKELEMELKPKLKNLKPQKAIYIHSVGPYDGEGTGEAWSKLVDFAKKKKQFGFKTSFYGISYDDPKITDSDKLRYEAAMTVRKDVDPEGEVGFKELPGGNYAVFRYIGPYTRLGEVYDQIYRYCMSDESGLTLRDAPCMEKYLNSPEKTKPEKLKTDIYIAVE